MNDALFYCMSVHPVGDYLIGKPVAVDGITTSPNLEIVQIIKAGLNYDHVDKIYIVTAKNSTVTMIETGEKLLLIHKSDIQGVVA